MYPRYQYRPRLTPSPPPSPSSPILKFKQKLKSISLHHCGIPKRPLRVILLVLLFLTIFGFLDLFLLNINPSTVSDVPPNSDSDGLAFKNLRNAEYVPDFDLLSQFRSSPGMVETTLINAKELSSFGSGTDLSMKEKEVINAAKFEDIKDFLSFLTHIRNTKHDNDGFRFDSRSAVKNYLNWMKLKTTTITTNKKDDHEQLSLPEVKFYWKDWVDLTLLMPFLNKNLYFDVDKVSLTNSPTNSIISKIIGIFRPSYLNLQKKSEASLNKLQNIINNDIDLNEFSLPVKVSNWDRKEIAKMKSFRGDLYLAFKETKIPSRLIFVTNEKNYKVKISNKSKDSEYPNDMDENLQSQPNDYNYDEASKAMDQFISETNNHDDSLFNTHNEFDKPNLNTTILKHEDFIYDIEEQSKKYNEIPENQLTPEIQHHREFLDRIKRVSQLRDSKHFHEVDIRGFNEYGSHCDWRFYKTIINNRGDHKAMISHMLRTWLKFTMNEGLSTWIAHGSLLGWYWNGMTMPWDTDADVQMPITHLDYLSRNFNNSLIIEDPREGSGRYLLEVGEAYVHRTRGNGRNLIDARFIDTLSGSYIDITGLALTNAVPDEHKKIINKTKPKKNSKKSNDDDDTNEEQKPSNLITRIFGKGEVTKENENENENENNYYNCKNHHFYTLQQLSPLRKTFFEGTESYIPNSYSQILKKEYPETDNKHYKHYNFINHLRLWVSTKYCGLPTQLSRVVDDLIKKYDVINNEYFDEKGNYKIKAICDNKELFKEYNETMEITKEHELEMVEIKNGDTSKIINKFIGKSYRHDPYETIFNSESMYME